MSKGASGVRTFAVAVVAVITVFVLCVIVWYTKILTDHTWCDRAIGAADEANARPIEAIGACFSLLTTQVEALAWNSHILVGIIALVLLVLVLLVVAGGEMSFSLSKTGASANIGKDVEKAAEHVADETKKAADAAVADVTKVKVDDPDAKET